MERAKRIATAFIGVAIAANCCEPTVAQPPNRFIRQPAKAPATPAPAIPAPATQGPVPTSPALDKPASAAPALIATQTPRVQALEPTVTAVVPPAPSPTGAVPPKTAKEFEAEKENVKLLLAEPKAVESKSDLLLSFPSLLSSTDLPDITFDALESFATVPDLGAEKPTAAVLDLSAPGDETKFGPMVTSTAPYIANSTPAASPRSSQLQWVSRAGSSSMRSQPSDLNEKTQPQSDANFAAHISPVVTRSNTSVPYSTQNDVPSGIAAKQQSDATTDLLNRIATRVDAIESKFEKTDEPAKQDRIRAGLVSARITNDHRFANDSAAQPVVTRIESPQGWQAIGTRLSDHVMKCESLLRRGAFCSAREEAEMASMLLFRHIDLLDNMFRCEPAVQSANQSLREAEDFLVALRSTTDGESLRRLVDAHETPVLKNKNLSGMSPLTAAQHYRQFAESKLVEAAQGHPWGSELLYTVGRTYQAEADAYNNRVDVLRMKAMAYYRASRITMPTNAVACNQLGYLLLQMDRNEEARETLVSAVGLRTDEAFLSNLAEASRRLGDTQTVTWASQSVAAIRSRTPQPSPMPSVIEVSQEEFIAISPHAIGPKPETESSPNTATQSTDRSAATSNAFQLR